MNKFDFNTIDEFDKHISNSILGYEILHGLVVNISGFFIKGETTPVDLGCTSGKLVKKVQETYGCPCIGYDITPTNFLPDLDLRVQDITSDDFEIPETNLVFSIFTLQFLPYKKRLEVLKKVYASLYKNGGFIFCEKEICECGIIQEVFTFTNYQNKLQYFTAEEILEKEQNLRPVMNPLEGKANRDLLRAAGFKTIEPFFQSLNFRGYLCKK